MPGITGSELAKQIKEEKPLFPLIALSSIDTFVTTQEFEKKLDKPINKIQLFNSIYHVLSKKQVPSAFIGDEQSNESESSSYSLSNFNKNVRILIAEDIIYNRNMLENMLENLSYTDINSAENGKIAIQMMENANNEGNPYEILLLDLRMPVIDGYGVINSIKEKGWDLPKIIVVSACVMDEDRHLCKTIGVQYFINKPIAMSQLKDVMLHATEML